MESEMEHSKTGVVGLFRLRVKSAMGNATARISTAGRDIVEVGKDDPRRAIHSLKVGLTLTLVSLIYYYQPLYTNFGATAMWAVMTVVVVFEFSVAAATTFMRFFPGIKARYDYGMLIFILTFSLVSISGYRYDEILTMAHRRLSTIFIGGATCVIVSIVVCPVWAGEDLHNLIALNMEKLGNFLEGFGDEFFGASADTDHAGTTADRSKSLRGYKTVLVSKSTEETMANFARWEPSHGEFRFRHPWKLYLELGALTRECAYRIEALDGYLNANLQVPAAARESIEGVCREVSSEAAKALKEMAVSVRTMTRHAALADPDLLLGDCHDAVKDLKALLKASQWKETDLLAAVPLFTVASLLIDVVKCTEKIAERVQELSSLANFREVESTSLLEKPAPRAGGKNKVPKPAVVPDVECPPPHIVLAVHEMAPENGRAPAPLNTS